MLTCYATAVNNATILSQHTSLEDETPRTPPKDAAAKDLTKLQASVERLVSVIVGLREPFVPEGAIPKGTATQQRLEIKASQSDLVSQLRATGPTLA